MGPCWRRRDELISDVLLWTPSHGQANAGRPSRTYIQQLCTDRGCIPEDLPEEMNDRDCWRERIRDIRADGATWWLWWLLHVNPCRIILCRIQFNNNGFKLCAIQKKYLHNNFKKLTLHNCNINVFKSQSINFVLSFNISNRSIWSIDWALAGTTSLSRRWLGSDDI